MIRKINDIANIDIDYDALSNYLFKKYRSVSTRYEDYLKEFEKNNIDDAKKYAKKYAELTPLHLLITKNIDKTHKDIVKTVNEKFIETINIIFFNAVCFWIVDTQENILKNNISLNLNYLNPNHIDKLNTHGLLYYAIELISDFFKYKDENDYMIEIKGLRKALIFIVEEEYKDKDANILTELLNKKNKTNRCAIDKSKYTDEELYYIDKLLFTPNNNSKYEKIHKYIQGCCLRKLDLNFNDISDFETTENTEIIKLKELHSKVRLINKERDVRFIPPKIIKKKSKKAKKKGKYDVDDEDNDFGIEEANDVNPNDDYDSEDGDNGDDIFMKEVKEKHKNIKFINNKPYIYNIDNYGVNEWLESMRGISDLLPDNLIDNLKNYEIDPVEAVITENILRLKKVKKNIGSDFLNCKYINYKEILLNICKILYVNVNSSTIYNENKVLKTKIMKSIKEIKKMINKHLYNLNKIKYYNDENADLINTINILIISNSLNFPDLSGVENIPKEFITYNAEELYEYLKTYLDGKYNKFLTPEEIAIFINKKREEYKIKKLKDNQNLDIEENEIRRQVKAAGIIKDVYNTNDGNEAEDGGDEVTGGKGGNEGDIEDAYKGEEKDADYNYNNNDNIYDDNDID